MNQVFESVTVTISKREYAELLGKAFAFDAYRRKLKVDIENGIYITGTEKALFMEEEPPKFEISEMLSAAQKEPDAEEIFTEEEWDKLAAEAEENKEV